MVLFEWQGKSYRLTDKQDRFCHEVIIDNNYTQAALRAGYSKRSARQIGEKNMSKHDIRARVDFLLAEIKSGKPDKIADATEVLERLTAIARGEAKEDVVVVVGKTVKIVQKRVAGREQVKAGELLAKGHGLLVDRVAVSEDVPRIVDDIKDGDGDA